MFFSIINYYKLLHTFIGIWRWKLNVSGTEESETRLCPSVRLPQLVVCSPLTRNFFFTLVAMT